MRLRLPERRHLASAMQDQGRAIVDGIVIAVSLLLFFLLIQGLDLFQKLAAFIDAQGEAAQFDEIVIVALFSVIGLVLFGVRRLQDLRREIRARQRAEDRAQHLALADALTGLPNRRQFGNKLSATLLDLAGQSRGVALMMIDLDRFKPVNDVFGHGIGDQVLIAFARRASAVAGSGAMLARLGGDEFALLLCVVDAEEPTRLARRLLALFERPFEVGEAQVTLGASIGIAMAPQDGTMPEELMRRADIALYRAKVNGRGNFRFFEEEMDRQVQKRAKIERDLRQAIDEGTVRPHYQPIVDLKTGRITGFELWPAGAIRSSESWSPNSSSASPRTAA